jgi:predicted dehydrogenase
MDVTFTDYASKERELLLKVDNYDYDAQYANQMKQFIAKSGGEICTLEEGINVTRIIDECEESNRTRRVLHV